MENLIHNTLIIYGYLIVEEVMELVESCVNLNILQDTFYSYNMINHYDCLQMLFDYEK